MDDIIKAEIEIPSDNEGFVLLKCEFCGGLFKLKSEDFENESVFNIYCPNCGLTCESYITDDVVELSQKIIENKVEDILMKKLKEMEKSSNGLLKVTKNGFRREYEQPIMLSIDTLQKKLYTCCKKEAKIKPILKFSGSYCPYCGVKDYGDE